MNERLVWQERFNIGVEIIDNEHKKLFSIINRLFDSNGQKSKSKWACQEGIKYFKNHAIRHFSEEEDYMVSINYSGYELHKHIHDHFRNNTLPALEKELEKTNYSEESVSHFLSVCAGWLVGHTLTEDQAIGGETVSRWGNLLPEKEHDAIGQAIIKLLYDIFQLNSKVISEHYGGEKFGNGIYYRIICDSKQNGQWEFFLIFEERMILNTIGLVMGFQFDKINTKVINASRYLSQQFLENLREYFPSVDLCDIKEENLLNYEQFQDAFKDENPRCSLLFDTGVGYFAFCAIAPDLLQSGIGASINAENAMTEVSEYIRKRVVSKKKKILVVDDSPTIRQFMKKLLEEDYEVEIANSGLSAFRCIILDKPDLLLLDYDMPICDGRQVLEMLRSETDISDIPVIFLTGRGDAESVSKVMSLNPEGYLLKNTRPAEIKKNIDVYFKMKSRKRNV